MIKPKPKKSTQSLFSFRLDPKKKTRVEMKMLREGVPSLQALGERLVNQYLDDRKGRA